MTITIRCVNDGKSYQVNEGASLLDIGHQIMPDKMPEIVVGKVNNRVAGLTARVYNNSDIEFSGIASPYGMRTYTRTLLFILSKAVSNLYKGVSVSVEAPISNGYYICLRHSHGRVVDSADVRKEMDKLIAQDLPFVQQRKPADEVIAMYERAGMTSKVKLLRSTGRLYTTYYTLDGYPDNYYGALCPSTGYIKLYGLENYYDGLLLRLPDPAVPNKLKPAIKQEKMLEVFNTYHRLQELGGVRTIGDLNEVCAQGYTNDVINVWEAFQERQICHMAEDIVAKRTIKMVLVAGPSSSGKTTFSKRLSVQLMTCGYKPVPISLDDYFVPRAQTPRDEKGDYDYETIDALNLPLLAEQLQQLFDGKEVELPRYDFVTGESVPSGKHLKLQPHDIVVIEGIHALNPRLTETIDDLYKYKIYVSALTTIQLDNHNYISPSDNRLMRRIVRDAQFRGSSAMDTIRRWPSVRAGERKWIIPFQENVDVMFNSALVYELASLRSQVMPLLEMVPENEPEYYEAFRLLKLLRYINPINIFGTPQPSLLREFLGGSTFKY
ncbi:MAG: nucleoside kinase [Bacteroidaceae bacterium]|nr:nucleoside kinase [Bacteroidaceae bacterium]